MKYKNIIATIFTAILLLIAFSSISIADTVSVEDISEEIIRFHVIANSDTENDQSLKMLVKENVISYIENKTSNLENVDEVREFLIHNDETIRQIAIDTITENGYGYDVETELTHCYFPVKSYGDTTFPAGEYEAYRIKIGESKGKNWWCVLYPPLCFVDAATGILPDTSKDMLKDSLGEDCYNTISGAESEVKFEFKFLPFLNFLFE